MKKILLWTAIQLGGFAATAQYSLQPVLPSAGVVQKPQLWNILVLNTSQGTTNCRLELTLRDRKNEMEVMTASTNAFVTGNGSRQLSAASLLPIQYNYVFTGAAKKADDFLTVGSYTACYRLMTADNKTLLAEACADFDAEPLSLPMLSTPADSSRLVVSPSQFTWIPPTPTAMFDQLHYEVVIAEILPGQHPQEAIQQNVPFYTEPYARTNIMSYSSVSNSFEKDKWYAWQVVARDENSYAGKSEVWVFSVDSVQMPIPKMPNLTYLLLKSSKDENAGINYVTGNQIFVKYYSYDKTHEGIIELIDAEGKILQQENKAIIYGDNFFNFKLNRLFKKGQVYTIKLKDRQGNIHKAFYSLIK